MRWTARVAGWTARVRVRVSVRVRVRVRVRDRVRVRVSACAWNSFHTVCRMPSRVAARVYPHISSTQPKTWGFTRGVGTRWVGEARYNAARCWGAHLVRLGVALEVEGELEPLGRELAQLLQVDEHGRGAAPASG